MADEPNERPKARRAALAFALPLALAGGLVVQIFVLVPREARHFDEMGLKLPSFTEQIVGLHRWLESHAALGAAIASAVVAVGVLLPALLVFGPPKTRGPSRTALAVFIAALAAANLVVWYAMTLPGAKLREGFAK